MANVDSNKVEKNGPLYGRRLVLINTNIALFYRIIRANQRHSSDTGTREVIKSALRQTNVVTIAPPQLSFSQFLSPPPPIFNQSLECLLTCRPRLVRFFFWVIVVSPSKCLQPLR